MITVALRGTVCGLPTALLGMLRVADSEPRFVANKTTIIEQLCPAPSEDRQKLSVRKSEWGVTETFPSASVPAPGLFNVTVWYSRLKRRTVPKLRLLGETFSCALTVIVQLAVVVSAEARPEESARLAMKPNGPVILGVPVMAPVLVFKVRPAGRLPLRIEIV